MAENRKLHIAMLPWLAFGHMMPYLELAKLIAKKGHKISFISTPRNIHRLPKLAPHLSPFIDFIKLPLPPVNNLPDGAEATTDLPYNKVKYLKIAYDKLQEPLEEFLRNSNPDWIFIDFAPYWAAPIARNYNIPTAYFSILIAAVIGWAGPASVMLGREVRTRPEDYTVTPNWIPFKTTVAFRLFEILRIYDSIGEEDAENVTDTYRMGKVAEACDIVILRSSYEVESEWLKVVEDVYQKPVFPVGQLPPDLPAKTGDVDDDEKDGTWKIMKEWLDEKEKGSVLYVAFGSEAKPSQTELTEIAMGLELSGFSFFWALRTRRGPTDPEVIKLPEGFEERNRGRGWVCTSWAPQLRILSHVSVGGFLTHSGWSSVVESIVNEKPLILLTFLADQGLNARFLEERKMAYSVTRDDKDGSFTRDSVAESVKLVMVEEEGKIYREKVREMKGVFANREGQDEYVNKLLKFLESNARK